MSFPGEMRVQKRRLYTDMQKIEHTQRCGVEICCGSFADALSAEKGGAHRIELNAALPLGGLTPSVASLKLVKERTSLKVICMARPRAAGFAYSDDEFHQMRNEVQELLSAGADGIAFGILAPDATIDLSRSRLLSDIIHEAGATAVFHRAFDLTPQPFDAIEALIEIVHADRVLTSGQRPTALAGAPLLAQLQKNYAAHIEILPGSGIKPENVAQLIRETGVTQVHASCKGAAEDPTTRSPFVSFAYREGGEACYHEKVMTGRVSELIQSASEAWA